MVVGFGGFLSHVPEVTQPRDLDVMSPEVDDLVLWISVNSFVSGPGWAEAPVHGDPA